MLVPHVGAGRVVGLAMDTDAAPCGVALAAQGLDQFPLAVAGDPGDADDLAGADGQADITHGDVAAVIGGGEIVDFEARLALGDGAAGERADLGGAEHHPRAIVGVDLADLAGAGIGAAAQHRDLVGERHHLGRDRAA